MANTRRDHAATTPRGKVLFITIDQWRADAMSAVGHPCARTPALDRLAADGALFLNHFAQCSPCGPSRASLLTGLYQMNHRSVRNGTPLDSRHRNLALEARRAGYDPMLFGYTDTSADPTRHATGDPALTTFEGVLPGFRVGCQIQEDGGPWRDSLVRLGYPLEDGPLAAYQPVDGGAGYALGGEDAPRPIYDAEHSDTAFLTDRVLEYLTPRRNEPWFAHVSFLRPHPPLIAPEPWRSLVDPADVPLPSRPLSREEEAKAHPLLAWLQHKHGRPGVYTGHDVDMAGLPERELRQVMATYYGLLAEVDHHVGRLVSHLENTGQLDETLIVITSDHGELLGDRWLFGKEGYFDPAFRVPLIVRNPQREAREAKGVTVKRFTEAVDIMPTLLDWIGLDVPAECDGRSLLDFTRGQQPGTWREAAHWEFDFRDVASQRPETMLGLTSDQCTLMTLRNDRYKYVHFTALPPVLHDMQEDPLEARNLADDRAYRGIALEMAREALNWRMLHADRRLTNTVLTADGAFVRNGPRIGGRSDSAGSGAP
ncbi:alkaline phosphatase family protein [Ferruginivarius sediminum]|uniref:Sulfatase N-terminal domain-containing protein n=1 Tax=Ferruginivarius sediminum TaxID=2661937 RepID=A0A369T6Q5_9PROT|nr:alkaline phosphatase family protein [Ferruginivarius sediminum]RDD60958.1 hypothetical protein DRB17_15330 [Ferruginivarius sediminum]